MPSCKHDSRETTRLAKGLQQLEHVYVLAVVHELLQQNALIFNEQNLQCQVRSWC
jgi:hypothetical protein